MLLEALVYALSLPATPRAFRPLVGEAIGLWARGRRQSRAWQPHLQRTQHAVVEAISAIAGRDTVAVLGSGPLFDVPLAALATKFRRVILVDRVHLFGAQRQSHRRSNAELQWRDLSAAAGPAPLAFLDEITGLDWVISTNLLSQLAHGVPEGSERQVVDAHLAALAALPCPATLITDVTYDVLDRNGRPVERFDLLYGRWMPTPEAQWQWDVAPFGEEHRHRRRLHRVAAYADWRSAAASG